MGLRDTIIGIKATGKDIKRGLLFETERLIFLKATGESGSRFTVLLEPTAGWLVTWNEFRAQMRAEYSTTSSEFKDIIAQASHAAYGIESGGKIDLYVIDPDGRDVVPPSAKNSDWKVFLTRDGKSRYTVPVVAPPTAQIEVSGSGNPLSHGFYDEMGDYNGKPYYNLNGEVGQADAGDPVTGIYWNGTTWGHSYWNGVSAEVLFYSTDDVDTPDLVVTWQILLGTAPVPTMVLS